MLVLTLYLFSWYRDAKQNFLAWSGKLRWTTWHENIKKKSSTKTYDRVFFKHDWMSCRSSHYSSYKCNWFLCIQLLWMVHYTIENWTIARSKYIFLYCVLCVLYIIGHRSTAAKEQGNMLSFLANVVVPPHKKHCCFALCIYKLTTLFFVIRELCLYISAIFKLFFSRKYIASGHHGSNSYCYRSTLFVLRDKMNLPCGPLVCDYLYIDCIVTGICYYDVFWQWRTVLPIVIQCSTALFWPCW